MPNFDPESSVIVEKTSDIGQRRKYQFSEGTFDTIDEVYEYIETISSGSEDSGKYEVRQPVGEITIEQDKQKQYSATERKNLEQIIEAFNKLAGVTEVTQVERNLFEWHITRPPYELKVMGAEFDIAVTVSADKYTFETVENELLETVEVMTPVFFEGKTEKFNRGDRTPSTYTVFFTIEREVNSVDTAHHLYQQVRRGVYGISDIKTVIKVNQIRVGTTHSYVNGEPFPDDAVLIDIGELTTKKSFMDDVVFTTEKTETEAFEEVRSELETHTNKSKSIYSNYISSILNGLPYEVNVIGAGEYSSGTSTRLVLGVSPK